MSETPEYRRRKRARLFARQNGLCHYCKRPMRLEPGPPDGRCAPDLATIEHVKPRSHGGTLADANTVAACFRCNNDRGDGAPRNQPRRSGPEAKVVWRD